MSAAQEAGKADAPVKPKKMFENCWGCRVVCGGGLLLSGAYVFSAARRVLSRGAAVSAGTVAQLTFAACLASWGAVILIDPVGKSHRVDEARPSTRP